jgi:uncharacterized protein
VATDLFRQYLIAHRRLCKGLSENNIDGYEMPQSKAELNACLLDLAKRYASKAREMLGDRLVSIALYGSVARGQAGPNSDIDLYVVLREAPAGMLSRRHMLELLRDAFVVELEELWSQGIYADFIEVIRTQAEARKFHPLYLDMSGEAILLYDQDKFLEKLLAKVREELISGGAERIAMGKSWYWDLSGSSIPEEIADL